MVNRKPIRERGKISLTRYFQELKEGDLVSIVKERSLQSPLLKRLQGRTGIVESKRGDSYVIKIKDGNKEKRIITQAINLKKLK
jgi:large subunit ribosomal protein L21e